MSVYHTEKITLYGDTYQILESYIPPNTCKFKISVNDTIEGDAVIQINEHIVDIVHYRHNLEYKNLDRYFTYYLLDKILRIVLELGKINNVVYPIIRIIFHDDKRIYEYHLFFSEWLEIK